MKIIQRLFGVFGVFGFLGALAFFGMGTALAATLAGKPEEGVQSFKECKHCPDMVVVPAGSFWMGSPQDELGRQKSEGPQRQVIFPQPFAVGKFEVTFDEWDACVAESRCPAIATGTDPDGDQGWGRGRRPVINVSLNDAQTYIAWLAEITGQPYRLLNEAEWEYAARAGTKTSRYGGSDPGQACEFANVADQAHSTEAGHFPCADSYAFTAPVGSFKPNAFGLYDMLGNVWEWVSTSWTDNYADYPSPAESDVVVTAEDCCHTGVIRGGAWDGLIQATRSAARVGYMIEDRNFALGFRVARSLR